MSYRRLQLERLTPADISRALEQNSLIYVPLGTIEWHGQHLPVGFDGISAHLLCLQAAERTGGLVMPPLFFGAGGGHTDYDWTIVPPASQLRPLLETTLSRLHTFGVKQVILYSGHFPHEQIDLMRELARNFTDEAMITRALAPSLANDAFPVEADHAALFETALMERLAPDLVFTDRLATKEETPDKIGSREDLTHPLYGVYGPDPREVTDKLSEELHEQLVEWIIAQVAN